MILSIEHVGWYLILATTACDLHRIDAVTWLAHECRSRLTDKPINTSNPIRMPFKFASFVYLIRHFDEASAHSLDWLSCTESEREGSRQLKRAKENHKELSEPPKATESQEEPHGEPKRDSSERFSQHNKDFFLRTSELVIRAFAGKKPKPSAGKSCFHLNYESGEIIVI